MTEIENVQELIKIPDEINSAVERAVSETLKYEECDFEADVSVTIVDDERIREINKEHRGIDKATDVLSFPMLEFDENKNALIDDFDIAEDGAVILGDIVISAERALLQAENYGHSFLREMAFLTVHSMLHLLGYDHVDDPQGEREMIEKQNEILKRLNITRD